MKQLNRSPQTISLKTREKNWSGRPGPKKRR